MIAKTELKILKKMFDSLTKDYSIRGISKELKMIYPQAHRAVQNMLKEGIISSKKQGRNINLFLDFKYPKDEYVIAEIERKCDAINKYPNIKLVDGDLEKTNYTQYICILFGSYACGEAKKDSDIDLLFIIPEEYDYGKFEKTIKNAITLPKVDLQITTEKGLIEMWNTPLKLNVGNELLKKHVVLRGIESFLHLRRKYYVG